MNRRSAASTAAIGLLASTGCGTLGEVVGNADAVRSTARRDASRPYYLDPCGQNRRAAEYRLVPPSGLNLWRAGRAPFDDQLSGAVADREACLSDKVIANNDPIAIRLNSVAIGGLSTFDARGKCVRGCALDVAVVIDVNSSETLNQPLIAYYQRGVRPEGLLSFQDQLIFAQEQWFEQNPPNIRIRLYDVHDDRDRALRSRLDLITKSFSELQNYISGAAIAGPVVNAARLGAEQLISGPRNRLILSMEFQLYPDRETRRKTEEGDQPSQEQSRRQAPAVDPNPAAVPLEKGEVERLQRLLGVDNRSGVGVFGPATRAAVVRRLGLDENATSAQLEAGARTLLAGGPTPGQAHPGRRTDGTFGATLYALPYIVFQEDAPGLDRCDPHRTEKNPLAGTMLGGDLPRFYYIPTGRKYGGGRVYSSDTPGGRCMLRSSYVLFSITRDQTGIAADVAKRMADLQAKFAGQGAVTEDAVAQLSSSLVDARLAYRISRLENTQKGADLALLIDRLRSQMEDARLTATDRPPLPGERYRQRAYRLIESYTGCPVNDDVALTDAGGQKSLRSLATVVRSFLATSGKLVRARGEPAPYFNADGKFTHECPKLGETKPVAERQPTPPNPAAPLPTEPAAQPPPEPASAPLRLDEPAASTPSDA